MPAPRINMRKLKDALRLTFEGQQSHQQIATALGITAGKDSLPGKLLQGKSQVFVFVGAACWRMVAVNVHHRRQRFACRQAPTREKPGLVFVGASLLANGGGQRSFPQAKIRLPASSYKGRGPCSTSKSESCFCHVRQDQRVSPASFKAESMRACEMR